ncbi:MAG: DUF6076 domain-containing protein [Lachnospiraceae bacterium]|nr:DUF6076 domain-containing protein [Lachnospiraceae bacterium]
MDYYLRRCRDYVAVLRYPEEQSEKENCDEFFQSAMMFFGEIESIIFSLPPYNSMNISRNRLYDLLVENPSIWEIETDEKGNRLELLEHFDTMLMISELNDPDLIDDVVKFNGKVKALATEYAVFIEDLIRLEKVYKPFLDKLHSQCRYLDNSETAAIVAEFISENSHKTQTYDKLQPSGNIRLSYTVLEKKKNPILCESYHFNTIGAFLYIELFKGLEQRYLPIKCGHCGRYFLLESGKFSQYCTRPIKGNEGKVCRDVGFREKYADKIKSDPVWLIYSRAYKQHYARYLKKKMSQAEFQRWADFALELRQRAIDGEIGIDEYEGKMRK